MKVILQKDVPGLGDAGEVKNVADGYARNFLLPRKLGTAARGNSTKALDHQKRMMQKKIDKRNKDMTEVADKLKSLGVVTISVRVGAKNKLFGSVTPQAIANALKDLGYAIDKRKVELTDSVRTTGNFKFKIRLAEKILVPMGLEVLPDRDSKVEEEEEAPAPKETQAEAAETQEKPSKKSR